MHIRVHVLPAEAAPTASLFALRHTGTGRLLTSENKVILCSDVASADKVRRQNAATAPVSVVVALIPEIDVRDGGLEVLAEPLSELIGLLAVKLAGGPKPPSLEKMEEIAEVLAARLQSDEPSRGDRLVPEEQIPEISYVQQGEPIRVEASAQVEPAAAPAPAETPKKKRRS